MLKQTTLSLKKALYLLIPCAIDVLRRPHTKLFLKTLTEITRCTETYAIGYFGHRIALFQQSGGTFQTNGTDEVCRSFSNHSHQLPIQSGAIHSHVVAQYFYGILRIIQVQFDKVQCLSYKRFVNIGQQRLFVGLLLRKADSLQTSTRRHSAV